MDNLLSRFLTKVGIKDIKPFEGGFFAALTNDKENNRISAKIHLAHYLSVPVYNDFFDTISAFTAHGGFGMRISFAYDHETEADAEKLLEEYKASTSAQMLDDYRIFPEEKRMLFYYKSPDVALDINEESRRLTDFLDSISSSYHVLIQEKVYYDDDFAERREEAYHQKSEEVGRKFEAKRKLDSTYQPCKLKDIENYRMVLVEGKIFKLGEARKTKKGMTIQPIEYTDGSDSITSTLFEGKRMTLEEMAKYTVGTKIRVKGKPFHNQYNHDQLEISIDEMEILPPDPQREDTYPRKRVELHAHTKMSAFDGLASVTDYAMTAKRWGHKAFAICDHGVVQAFPEAQKAAKAAGIKIIYGAELYVVDDKLTYIYNSCKRNLSKETYVVFDTETTGLSCRYDRLIEFGAVKVTASGEVIDDIDFFINPDMKLSRFSLETSHIRQEQVDNGKPIKKALQDILEFFGDSILVAHNAAFDYGFLNEALQNNGMEPIKNPVIDTLPLSRYLYPDMRSHTEESLARKLEVDFDSTGAHRANYDAGHLAKIFSVMLSTLSETNPDLTHEQLALLPVSKQMLVGLHPYHVTAYIQNQDGVKNLYKIISISNTEYLAKDGTPRVPVSLLEKYRQNLIFGSACFNGKVWETATTKSKETLMEVMKPYDFIEVQPPENYIYQIHTGMFHSLEEVEAIQKDLIETARNQGKIVVATGDCHYLNPEDKIFRDVFISSKGLKGARHPLNLAPYDSASEEKKKAWYAHPLPNPDQHFRTTDEMMQCFAYLNDTKLEEEIVIDNTNKIADSIAEGIKPLKDGTYSPYIPGADEKLRDLCFKTAHELYGDPLPQVIQDRLDTELKGIIDNGYAVIYWLSSEIVRWSNSEGYMIGSRGSVGSSLVAMMTGITEVNALPPHYRCPHCHYLEWADLTKYDSGFDLPAKKCPKCGHDLIGDGQNIPFATFLGFHAEKVPDIDLNFPSDFQSRAHLHMQTILNATGNTCYKAGTIQTTQEKQARGYVLGYFESLGIDTSKVRDAEIDRIASGCIDVKRSTGQHPGGVIVIPKGYEAEDFTPVQYPADDADSSWKTTHYDFHAIHDNVLKFDMLGHVDPQAIRMQCDLCGFSFLDMKEKIPISDPEAHSLFWSPDALHLKKNVLQQETGALGLPEFGTENGRRVLLETKPRSFSDLVRISGLSHGTNVFAGNAEDLITQKGFKLKDVIACRDDIMTVLHDKYGVDNSDAFAIMEFTRKGRFGKPGDDDKKAKYDQIMREHNVPEWYIESCHKIAYMFPKGHAVAYVSNCIRCAWFKVHKPLAYYATYFTLRCDAYDIETMMKGIEPCLKKRNDILERQAHRLQVSNTELATINAYEQTIEMYDRGYSFAPLNVMTAEATNFTIDEKKNQVIPSLTCVNSLGASLAEQIVSARKESPFTSVEDLKQRGRVGDKMVDTLRKLGALEGLPEDDQMTLF
ncbi:MAG: PolC-type DNA polymerase III [Eubacteriales bacterium]|nr:PolC-type DNA polymerase III [Eubacteriales bacterium]